MPFVSYALFVVALLNLLLAVVILNRNIHSRTYRYLAATILFNVLWSIGDGILLSSRTSSSTLLGELLFFIAPMLTSWFLLLFSSKFADIELEKLTKYTLSIFVIVMVIYVATLNPLIENFAYSQDGLNSFTVDKFQYSIYTMYFTIVFFSSYIILFLGYKKERIREKKKQLQNVFWAALAGSIIAMITNLTLPYLGNSNYIWVGPITTLIYIVILVYSIARNRLFDIKNIVFRSVTYFFSLVVIILTAQASYILLTGFGTDKNDSNSILSLLSLALFFIAGLSFNSLRRVFDKLTAKLFYRDAYDSQIELDRLSGIAVSQYKVENLVVESMGVIQNAIKPSSGVFILLDAHGDYYNDYKIKPAPEIDVIKSLDYLNKQNGQMFDLDDYDARDNSSDVSDDEHRFAQYLRKNDITLSIRISTKDEIVGYVLFGPKLSGNLYSNQDKNFIAIAANELAIAVQNARRFDEIQQFNETLKLEIERATSELRTSNEKLQALDVAKDEFITMASHQLRTPLTSVKGYLSMVLEGDVGKVSPRQRQLLGAAFSSSQRMVYLIGDLLNVSRLQTGKFVIEPTVVNIVDMILSEIDQLKETARSKKLKINFKEPKNFPMLYLDETKTRQVIMNYIDNSIYYTPVGGEIEITLEDTSKEIRFLVKDNGIGVPKSEQHNLFSKFYRAANARKARPDGTGLGLFMAKKVIIDQGGAVIFKSKEGKGSIFGFSFPKSRLRPPQIMLEEYNEKHKDRKGKKRNK